MPYYDAAAIAAYILSYVYDDNIDTPPHTHTLRRRYATPPPMPPPLPPVYVRCYAFMSDTPHVAAADAESSPLLSQEYITSCRFYVITPSRRRQP